MFSAFLGLVTAMSIGWNDAATAWNSDYTRACTQASSSDKPLFILICSGSSEYHQLASLGVFLSERLEKTLQSDYVRLFIDTDSVAGKELAQKFDAGDEPHFVILDRSGRWQVFYKSGYLLEGDLTPVLAQFRRTKLSANGTPIRQVVRQPVVQLCST